MRIEERLGGLSVNEQARAFHALQGVGLLREQHKSNVEAAALHFADINPAMRTIAAPISQSQFDR
jgi:hypothetical protein